MNRFKISIGRGSDFVDVWRNRETHLEDVTGFQKFNLLKGSTNKENTLYISHSTWKSKPILRIGKNQKHLEKHIVVGDSTKEFI